MNSIYVITNCFNDKVYVGQTWQTLEARFAKHKNSNHCIKLHNAIKKHESENFKIQLLVTTENQMTADYIEKFWMTTYDSIKNGYNLKEAGARGKTSEETKDKLSISMKGKNTWSRGIKYSDELKIRLSNIAKGKNTWMKGRKPSPETNAKRTKAMSNKTWKLINGKRAYSERVI